jgi:hypothetical protein
MKQLHRNRIWEMVARGLANKTKLIIPKDKKQLTQVIDPDEIIKDFKESIQKAAAD